MDLPSAVCPRCGYRYCGWALLNPRHQLCGVCGTPLKITAGGQEFTGYSPLDGQKLTLESPESKQASPPLENPNL